MTVGVEPRIPVGGLLTTVPRWPTRPGAPKELWAALSLPPSFNRTKRRLGLSKSSGGPLNPIHFNSTPYVPPVACTFNSGTWPRGLRVAAWSIAVASSCGSIQADGSASGIASRLAGVSTTPIG